jgi:8-oxo-dGTP diphosphatase
MSCIDVTLPPLAPNRPLLLVSAAAIIDSEDRILLAKRPEGKNMGGLWEFPGGKVQANETPEAALVRELKEELGIITSTGCLWPLTFASHGYADFHLLLPLFACRVWQGTPHGKEGQDLAWAKKDRLRDYPMPPADVVLIEALWELL